jgi:hypothetical protein
MGVSAVPTAVEGGQVGSALAGYDEWVASYLHDDHARKSDEAMKALQNELADNTTMSNIVQVNAIFQGSASEQVNFYLQMPWYDNGTLAQWPGGDSRPEWTQVRSVLLDALVAVGGYGVVGGALGL